MIQRIGILGGTFDPIHNGHLAMAKAAVAALHLDLLLFLPAGNPYFKKNITPYHLRYEMVSRSLKATGDPALRISSLEANETKPTYTYETLQIIKQLYPGAELFFLCGEDVVETIHTWKCPELLFDRAVLSVFSREFGEIPKSPLSQDFPSPNDHKMAEKEPRSGRLLHLCEELKQKYPNVRIQIIPVDTPDISSTMVRQMAKNGDSVRALVPAAAAEIILKEKLYLEDSHMERIINSLLETDTYKFSMGQAIYHQFPDYTTVWTFKCRNEDVHFTKEMVDEIRRQIYLYCDLRFQEEELDYLRGIKWFKNSYIDFLRLWHPRFEDFMINDDAECGLHIETRGTWLNTSMYEIPTLAIVNEVYFRMRYVYGQLMEQFLKKLEEKIEWISSGKRNIGAFSEFGLRRRLSAEAQDLAVRRLKEETYPDSTFVGTSSVYLAKKYGVTPVGTMAHEWLMCIGQGNHKHNPAYSNWYALDYWVKEYGILNGTALTDAITTDCFLRDFQLTFATLFSGVRHDSGDPYEWGEKMIRHYEELGIDPTTKTLLFSDSLNFEKADKIRRHFQGRAKVAFGIGTYLANDTDVEPLNIVMKTTACNGQDVAKISDSAGKGICRNPEYIKYLQRCIDWRMLHEEE